jgi:hypothetical protein
VLKVASEYARVWLYDNLIADRDELEQLRRKWIQVFASPTGHTHWQQATRMLTVVFTPVWILSSNGQLCLAGKINVKLRIPPDAYEIHAASEGGPAEIEKFARFAADQVSIVNSLRCCV